MAGVRADGNPRFWAEVGGGDPSSSMKPTRDELCSAPFLEARDRLCKPKSKGLKPGVRAWVWDWLDRRWRGAERRDLHPGRTVLVERRVGGYRQDRGWDPGSTDPVAPVEFGAAAHHESGPCWTRDRDGWRPGAGRVRTLPPEDHADAAEDDESLSMTGGWQTIATHGLRVGEEVERITAEIAPDKAGLLHLAGRWHDLGKAHAAFQGSIQADGRLLHIHPFEDFNGRVSRLFLVERLYRLDLPVIDPDASSEEETARYFAALRAYDRRDPRPLSAIWRRRFSLARILHEA